MGVDYGAKLAGTTAVAMLVQGELRVWQSPAGQDADKWLRELVLLQQAKVVYIDAPLSLPAIYGGATHTTTPDYFYRQADRELQAMSPMFIGGLTARAIQLRAQLALEGVAALETYPSALVSLLLPELQGYKQEPAALPAFAAALQGLLPVQLQEQPRSWHHFDAVLAWFSGYRHSNGQSELYGDAREGRIIV